MKNRVFIFLLFTLFSFKLFSQILPPNDDVVNRMIELIGKNNVKNSLFLYDFGCLIKSNVMISKGINYDGISYIALKKSLKGIKNFNFYRLDSVQIINNKITYQFSLLQSGTKRLKYFTIKGGALNGQLSFIYEFKDGNWIFNNLKYDY